MVGEEDDLVRALEWADSIGVDLVTSSLGYYIFADSPAYSYTFADMDGNTAITTIACDIAYRFLAELGMVSLDDARPHLLPAPTVPDRWIASHRSFPIVRSLMHEVICPDVIFPFRP